jgi:ATP-dependent exoDNAse (exonuclease V) alpha subunit
MDWDQYEYYFDSETKKVTAKIVGKFNQIAVKLAQAVTIHKSQGMTLENIFIDHTFVTEGLIYVALSRCKTLQGIGLKRRIKPEHIKVSKESLEFMSKVG